MVMRELKVSERRACKTIGQIRSTQRYEVKPNPDQARLEERVIALASEYGRYGYRQTSKFLKQYAVFHRYFPYFMCRSYDLI
jgi:hypothetical protein